MKRFNMVFLALAISLGIHGAYSAVVEGASVVYMTADGDAWPNSTVSGYAAQRHIQSVKLSNPAADKYYRLHALNVASGPCVWEHVTSGTLVMPQSDPVSFVASGSTPVVLDTDDTTTGTFKLFLYIGY